MPDLDFEHFRDGFLAEAHELIDAANQHLAALDEALREGRNDPRAVRELFRALHTMKGLSSMVGVEPVVALSHALETILRQADQGWGRLPLGAIDVLDEGVRAIAHRLGAVERDDPVPPPSQELLEAIDAIALVEQSQTDAPPLAIDEETLSRLTPGEREILARAPRSGKRAVALDFVPSPDRSQAGIDINRVREEVARLAEIVRVLPIAVSESERAPGGLVFRLLVVTDATDEALAEASRAPEVHPVAHAPLGPALPEDPEEDEGVHGVRSAIRVEVSRLEHVLDDLSALVVTRFRLEREIERLREQGVDVRETEGVLRDLRKQLRELRGNVMRVRLVPVAEVLDRIPLLVRGLARTTGKQVRLDLDAGRAEVDKAVADRLFPAVVHLVRNAVDHAIEQPDERARLGKPREGHVRVTCFERANSRLELVVADDGRGIDAAEVARSSGEEVDSDQALLDLLTRPGFTTRREATTTSGRGLGMDIVRRIAERELGGALEMRTEAGRGTSFTLRVPLSLAILDVFAFASRGQTYVVPVSSVEEIVELDPEGVRTAPGTGATRRLMQRRGRTVPVVSLAELFGGDDTLPSKALIVQHDGHPWGFGVDRLLGQHEVVVRAMDHPLVQVRGVAGATDLGDGRPTLVLDLVALGRTLLDAEAST